MSRPDTRISKRPQPGKPPVPVPEEFAIGPPPDDAEQGTLNEGQQFEQDSGRRNREKKQKQPPKS